jgi:hypothetical protein
MCLAYRNQSGFSDNPVNIAAQYLRCEAVGYVGVDAGNSDRALAKLSNIRGTLQPHSLQENLLLKL